MCASLLEVDSPIAAEGVRWAEGRRDERRDDDRRKETLRGEELEVGEEEEVAIVAVLPTAEEVGVSEEGDSQDELAEMIVAALAEAGAG